MDSIGWKVAFAVALTVAMFVAGSYLVLERTVLPGFGNLERAEAQRLAWRAARSLDRELQNLASIAADFGTWDDTYAYAETRDPAFIAKNFSAESLQLLNLNVAGIYAVDGTPMWHLAVAFHGSGLPAERDSAEFGDLAGNFPGALLYGCAPYWNCRGILKTSAGPMMAAGIPILMSDGTGEARGTLVLGRLLNPAQLERIHRHTGLRFEVSYAAAGRSADDSQNPIPVLGDIGVSTLEDGTIRGSVALREMIGEGRWLVLNDTAPVASALGRETVNAATVGTAALGAAVLLVLFLVMQKVVLTPLRRLRGYIGEVSEHGTSEDSPLHDRRDELGVLAREFDGLTTRVADAGARLRAREAYQRMLYDESPSMLSSVSDTGALRAINRYGASYLGYAREDLLQRNAKTLYAPADHADFDTRLNEAFAGLKDVHVWEMRKLRRDGDELWVRETARLLDDEKGESYLLIVSQDITESRRLSEELVYQATHDALTRLVNRREFEARLNRVVGAAKSASGEHALMFLDLDRFKQVNDTFGHAAGDALLQGLSGALALRLRSRDTLARIGGDEFAVLMEHCSLDAASRVAGQLLETVKEYQLCWQGTELKVGVSIGIVAVTRLSGDATIVMRLADKACYEAKQTGRNRVAMAPAESSEPA